MLIAWKVYACDAFAELEQRKFCSDGWQAYQGCGLQAEYKTIDGRASLQNHCGSQFKTSNKLARLAGAGLVWSKATEDTFLNWSVVVFM